VYPFGFHLFSFFNARESHVWSFNGVAEFLNIPSVFSLIFILSSSSEILSSYCASNNFLFWTITQYPSLPPFFLVSSKHCCTLIC
jgi:hypothetical protein